MATEDQESVSSPAVVLRHFAAEGYGVSFRPGSDAGTLVCPVCGKANDAARFPIAEERRLEGASDPDDMLLVIAATCPNCRARGAVVLGYGPESSAEDADLVIAFSRVPSTGWLSPRRPAG